MPKTLTDAELQKLRWLLDSVRPQRQEIASIRTILGLALQPNADTNLEVEAGDVPLRHQLKQSGKLPQHHDRAFINAKVAEKKKKAT